LTEYDNVDQIIDSTDMTLYFT